MERLTKYVNGVVWYDYKGNKYPAYDMDNSDMLHALNRLAQLEDEAEQREQGCELCKTRQCITCSRSDCIGCNNYSGYKPDNYCLHCGKRLVE